MMKETLPKELQELIKREPYTLDDMGMSGSKILLFEDKVLKIQPDTKETQSEHCMMTWLSGKVPVPECLYHKVEGGKNYLLMSKVAGEMSCAKGYMEDPKALTKALAEALKRLWSVDIQDCPVAWTLDAKLREAEELVRLEQVDTENMEPPIRSGKFRIG